MTRDWIVKVDAAALDQAHDQGHGRHDFRQRGEIEDGVVAGGRRSDLVRKRSERLAPERLC